jgi:glycyl-tRNA synthetase
MLDPVSVEITYGLERILIGMLSLDHFKDIPWNESLSYGDVRLEAEVEHSRYYLELADIGRLKDMYTLSEAEARAALEHDLILPAYDNLLHCSHLFNVLDARGAVGVTERAALFGRMRELSREISEKYVDQRRRLEFPWMDRGGAAAAAPPRTEEAGTPPAQAETFVLEIGTEELPAGDVSQALETLEALAPALLEEHRLACKAVRVAGTPRRLIVEVAGLAPTQDEVVELVKGPPEARAFDAAGAPTPAAAGWARKQGLPGSPEALRGMVRDLEGGRYLAAEVRRGGEATSTVLARQVLPRLVEGIAFDQTMRWIGTPGDSPGAAALRRTAFARPIRWLMALHGGHLVAFEFAGLRSGRTTRGLRLRAPEQVSVSRAADYRGLLAAHGVLCDPAERQTRILEQARALARGVAGQMENDEALLREVANLVEAPQALLGDFDSSFLSLPDEVLVAVMKKHQRYFPVRDGNGRLLPHFIVVGNGGQDGLETIRAGNEHVLRARFADADFFLHKDREHPLEFYRPLLARLTFQAKLGTILDKAERVESLAPQLAADLRLTKNETAAARRAAFLCKADLATAMVAEMTSLQGVLGRIYALESGETEAVAQAIFEHHLPRFPGDALPETPAGIAVGLADRLDTLAGLFAAGMQPSGARDPFALRRTAVGLVQLLVTGGLRVDLRRWLELASRKLPIAFPDEALGACLQFIAARQEALLLSEGRRYDVVAAILQAQGQDPAGVARAVVELEAAVADAGWPPVLQAYARCARILPRPASKDSREGRGMVPRPSSGGSKDGRRVTPSQKVGGAVDPRLFEMEAERVLYAAVEGIRRPAESVGELVRSLQALVALITEFFDKVLVMDEDKAKRANRLALVGRVVELADGIADLSRLEGF